MITQKEMDEIFIATLKSISQVCDITTPGNVAHNLPTIKCKCRDMLSFYKNNTITPWYSVAEGDIIEGLRYKHFVKYDNVQASYVAINVDYPEDSGCHITEQWIKECDKVVIGNIYDNKELIKQL